MLYHGLGSAIFWIFSLFCHGCTYVQYDTLCAPVTGRKRQKTGKGRITHHQISKRNSVRDTNESADMH